MEDRIPSPGQEGRVLITPENGEAYYAKIAMADNPTNPGTALNKQTLLQDSTEVELFGSAENRTVDQAFSGIASKISLIMGDMASITLTVTDQDGNAVKSALVNGIFDEDSNPVYTNSSGVATGYIAEGPQTISITGYADLTDTSKSITVVKGETLTETLNPTRRNFFKAVSSGNLKFSGNVSSIDYTLVGGGQAGGEGWDNGGGSGISGAGCGGFGGNVIVKSSVAVSPNTAYPVVIGAGGVGHNSSQVWIGNPGGSSTFMGDTALGGSGTNSRQTSPGAGPNGAVGTTGFSSYTETTRFGGDGGGGGYASQGSTETIQGPGGTGGADTGADGGTGDMYSGNGDSAQPNTGGGGGGGAYYIYRGEDVSTFNGGNGGSGVLTFRIHFDFGELAA